jgi:hypothetical protein
MPSIHFIERLRNITRLTGTKDEYESGYWVVSTETAEKLLGADIYLHEGQAKPSYFGGKIMGYRVHQGGELDGRLIFHFKATPEHRGVAAGRGGWGNEKKIVW